MSLIQEKEKSKFYAHCGLCDKDFKTKSGCDNHFKSPEHQRRVVRWYELCESCIEKWMKFFDDNSDRLTAKYPKEFNPTWRIFLGKERVQFT